MDGSEFFLIDFDIWNIEIRVRMRKLDQFYERTLNQRTKREQCAQNWSQQQGFDGNSEDKCNKKRWCGLRFDEYTRITARLEGVHGL